MAEQLQIQVQANVSNAISNLNSLQKELAETNTAAVKTGTAGMQTFAKGAGQANTAMINLGRTVSDAPFGFIGIANNLGPLVENFVILKREAGSTGGALKALGASLAGPGGLIVGIQLVVAAVQFAQLGLSRWGASAQKAKDEQEQLRQTVRDSNVTIEKQKIELESLLIVAKDVNQTENTRIQALKKLNDILPDTIGKLNEQNIVTSEGVAIISQYISAIEAKATAELLVNKIAENNVKLLELQQKKTEELGLVEGTIFENSFIGRSVVGKITENINEETEKLINTNKELSDAYKKLLPQTLNIDKVANETKETKKEEKTIQEKINELLKDYNESLKGINWDEQNRQIDGTEERIKLAGDTLKNLYLLGVRQTSAEWQKVNSQLREFQRLQNYKSFRKGLEEINNSVKEQSKSFNASEKTFQDANTKSLAVAQNNIKIILGNYKLWESANKAQIAQQQKLAETITNAVSPAIDSVINAFAEGEDPFQALTQSVKQLISELAKAVIKSLILKAITSAIAPGAGALGGGTAGQFLIRGDMLRNITLGR